MNDVVSDVPERVGMGTWGPVVLAGAAFILLFQAPFTNLLWDWWYNPDAGHGLLLGPLAIYLGWKAGLHPDRRSQPWFGLVLLAGSVLLRYLSGLAAEMFTMRMSMMGAACALIVFVWGFRQLMRWWLPVVLFVLSVPLPVVVLTTISFPLQLQASQLGAALLEWRQVPVLLAGNVIHLPGRSLFVTEACSGLRSLTALTALAVLMGGVWLHRPWSRIALLAVTIPVAIIINGWRVFMTGFLVFFVDPALGEGFMHYTEGWVLFVVAFAVLGGAVWLLRKVDRRREPAS